MLAQWKYSLENTWNLLWFLISTMDMKQEVANSDAAIQLHWLLLMITRKIHTLCLFHPYFLVTAPFQMYL